MAKSPSINVDFKGVQEKLKSQFTGLDPNDPSQWPGVPRNLLFLAGKADGPYIGKVGRDVTIDEAYAYARQTGIQLLGVIAHELGSIDRVTQIVKVFGLVNATDDFTEHPKVMNGCSDLLEDVFGENGRHARTSVGAGSLPGNIPVEIDMVVEFA